MSQPDQPLSLRKVVSLDGVRGLAILAVMLSHCAWRLHPSNGPQQVFSWLLSHGWVGVDLFFVLSGFLITGILLDSRRAQNFFQSFYARRALRIFPLFYAFLLLSFGLFPLVVPADWMPANSDRWIYPCYLANWLVLWHGPWHHSVMAHLWSLAVEEQFYFCWPLLVWLLRPSTLWKSLLLGEAAVIAGRCWWVAAHGGSQAVALATVSRMDGLLLGAICAIVVRQLHLPERLLRRLPMYASAGLFLFLLLALTAANADRFYQTIGFPLLAFCFAMVVLYAVLSEGSSGAIQKFLCRRRLTRIGKYAYGLYVYHVPLFFLADRVFEATLPESVRNTFWFGCISSAVLIVLSYQVARLSYSYFECRFLNLKDRFEPRYAS